MRLRSLWPGRVLLVLIVLSGIAGRPVVAAPPADPWIDAHLDELLKLYRHLHTHPELSYQEIKTAGRIADELRRVVGMEITEKVGGTGVVGVLKNGEGPVVLVRTDMDALPVAEETGLPFASKEQAKDQQGRTVGVMHACGHDVHMSCFVGTARWLADHRDRWNGTVLLVAQPAEEAIGGAKAMLDAGLYRRFPKPDYALALHCAAEAPAGSVFYCPGPMLASSTSVSITIRGKGGHGAWPHRTVDPILLASMFVVDLQSIVSREIEPIQPAVVTVGSIHGGTKHNIIPDEVKLQLTLRTFSEEVRQQLLAGIRRRAEGLAKAHNAPESTITIDETTPPTINSAGLVEKVVESLGTSIGADRVRKAPPVMGAEDFGLFGEGGVPICMFWLGTIEPSRLARAMESHQPMPALHSSRYRPDAAPSIATGIRAMTSAVADLLPPKNGS